MTTIIGLSGSLRRGSYNASLLRAAASLAPPACTVQIETFRDFPLYDGDLEAEHGVPPSVADLKDRIATANGLLLVTPEYNNSIPGVFKNAIDWLSRPATDIDRVFGNKPIGLMGASPGRMGTAFAQTAWLPVFRALGARPFFGNLLYVAGAAKLFDGKGLLTDEDVRARLRTYMSNFALFCSETRVPG